MKVSEIVFPLDEFNKDVLSARNLLENNDDQDHFLRRTYIRALFAFVEGTVWVLKNACINARPENPEKELTPGEYALLKEITFELGKNGKYTEKTKHLNLQSNLKFCVNMFNQLFDSDIDLQIGTQRWENFKKAIKIRNRITHPKRRHDLLIKDEDVKMCIGTECWFCAHVIEAVKQIEYLAKFKKN